jgi:HEAT repeat protein
MTRNIPAQLLSLLALLAAMILTASCAPNIESLEKKQDVEGLIRALEQENADVREDAAKALGRIGDPRAVEPLIAALKDGDDEVRTGAAVALRAFQDDRAIDALITALKDEDKDVRRYSAYSLGEIGDLRAVEPLIAAFKDEDHPSAPAKALGKIGDPRAVELLIAALKDESWGIRDTAAEALGQIGDPRAVEPLTTLLHDEDGNVRKSAILALDNLGWYPDNQEDGASYWAIHIKWEIPLDLDFASFTQLITALYHPESEVRQAAAQKLGQAGDPRAVEPLIAALKDKDVDEGVHQSAVEALGQIGEAAVEPLIAVFKDRNFPSSYAIEALGQIGEPAVEPLIAAFLDEDFPSAYAARALGRIGDPRAVEPLIAALKDKDKTRRIAVAEALGQIGDPRAIEPIIAVLEDEDGKVRGSAYSALVQIGLDDPSILLPFLKDASTVKVYSVLIRIGDPATVGALVTALSVHGTKEMAEYYLNCGNKTLETAATQWGKDHGYMVMPRFDGGSSSGWGSK